jgi:TolB-like protein
MSSPRSSPRASAAAFVLLASLLLPFAADAAPRRVAVLRLEFEGELPENGRNFLSQRLIEGLAAADFQVFAGLVVTQLLKQGEGLENCRAAACYQQIARRLGVEYLVTGVVHVEQKDYEVTLELVSGRDGRSLGQSRETCELCGIKEAGQLMDKQVLGLREFAAAAAATAPARYVIETSPPGAEVKIDGKPAGQTPLSVDVPAGAHKLSLSVAGQAALERSLEVESGTNGVLSLDLGPGGANDVEASFAQHQRHLRYAGLVALAAGTLAAVGGAIELSLDGSEVDCKMVGTEKKCQFRETSLESGLAFGLAGGLLATGGVMLYMGWGDGRAAQPGATQSFVFGARGTF